MGCIFSMNSCSLGCRSSTVLLLEKVRPDYECGSTSIEELDDSDTSLGCSSRIDVFRSSSEMSSCTLSM